MLLEWVTPVDNFDQGCAAAATGQGEMRSSPRSELDARRIAEQDGGRTEGDALRHLFGVDPDDLQSAGVLDADQLRDGFF